MASPSDRRFTESHEWYSVDGDLVTWRLVEYDVDKTVDILEQLLKYRVNPAAVRSLIIKKCINSDRCTFLPDDG